MTDSDGASRPRLGWRSRTTANISNGDDVTALDSAASSRRPSLSYSLSGLPGRSRTGSTSSTAVRPVPANNASTNSYAVNSPADLVPQRSSHSPSRAGSATTKSRILPLRRKSSGERAGNKPMLDLSKSMAENQDLGLFVGSTNTVRSGAASGVLWSHGRSSSGVSHHSTTTSSVSSLPRSTRPLRPSGASSSTGFQSTQPLHPSARTSSDDDRRSPTPLSLRNTTAAAAAPSRALPLSSTAAAASSYAVAHSFAPVPTLKRTTPPPLHISTSTSALHSTAMNSTTGAAAPRLKSTSQTNLPATPSSLRYAAPSGSGTFGGPFSPTSPEPFSASSTTAIMPPPSLPLTERSSLDSSATRSRSGSAFGMRSTAPLTRSRTSTTRSIATLNTSSTPDDPHAAVAALRAEFAAREAAKEQRYAAREARRAAKREDSAQRKASRSDGKPRERRIRAFATATPSGTPLAAKVAALKSARNGAMASTTALDPEKMNIAAVGYDSTVALGASVSGLGEKSHFVRDEELEYIRQGKRPPKHLTTAGQAASAYGSGRSGTAADARHRTHASDRNRRTSSRWQLLWFRIKSLLLRLRGACCGG